MSINMSGKVLSKVPPNFDTDITTTIVKKQIESLMQNYRNMLSKIR